MKVWNVALGKSEDAVSKLVDSQFTPLERAEFEKFLKDYKSERTVVLSVHSKIKDKLDGQDEQTAKEWTEYLNADLDLKPMRYVLLKKGLESCTCSLSEEKLLEALSDKPVLEVVQ